MIIHTDGATGPPVPARVAEAQLRPARLHIACRQHAPGVRMCVGLLERNGHVFRCYLYFHEHGRTVGGQIPCRPSAPVA